MLRTNAKAKSRHLKGSGARSSYCGRAVHASTSSVTQGNRRFLLIAGLGASVAFAAQQVRGRSFDGPGGSGACAPASLVEDTVSLRDQMAIVMDTTACMSTLYAHTSQYLREVNGGFRSSDMLPDNVMRTITNLLSLNSMPRFMEAVNAIAQGARPPSTKHAQELSSAVSALGVETGVLKRCCSDIAAHSTDMTQSCQQLVTSLREVLAQVDVLQRATAIEGLPNGGRCALSA